MGPDTQVEIRNISCAQMHINISITAAGNGAYNNFCNVLKFKRFMLDVGIKLHLYCPVHGISVLLICFSGIEDWQFSVERLTMKVVF